MRREVPRRPRMLRQRQRRNRARGLGRTRRSRDSLGRAPRWTPKKVAACSRLCALPSTRTSATPPSPNTSNVCSDAPGKTVHQLEALVAGKKRGATPDSAPDPGARRHVLRFEVSAETFAVFREAVDKVRRDSGGRLDDDSTLMEMARHVLGGPSDEGRSSYQIALSVCPSCRRGYQESLGELVPVGENFVAVAECDW